MPPLPPSDPPVLAAPPPMQPVHKPEPVRQLLTVLLSLFLGCFLVDAIISLADDSLGLWLGIHLLRMVRGMVAFFVLFLSVVVYGMIGLTPMIPKRFFLPLVLFNLVGGLLFLPLTIYFYGRLEQITWVFSLCQVVVGLSILGWVLGGFRLHWPFVREGQLGWRGFSWLNLCGFLGVNVFVLLPAVVVYLFLCAALAVGHFSEGFMALRPSGFTVQVRKYVRDDGKIVQLVPMAHIGEADFYQKLLRSFPTNALVLMEGVTDGDNLLTNKVTYKRVATSLGLAEQHEQFNPVRVAVVMADVDIKEFSADTIGFLNLVMLLHNKGLTPDAVLKVLSFTPPPRFEQRLWEDLLHKRNRHLLSELRSRLPDSDTLIVPWGVAHMPGIAEGIQTAGFRLAETREYTVIRFRPPGSIDKPAKQANGAGKL